jgi:hypothetical protein
MSDHRVPNLKAAVELSESWLAADPHIWFRGQNRLWPIASSLSRHQDNSEEIVRYNNSLQQFCDWLKFDPELRHLLEKEHVHAFFAILQHYGVPTHYVDFTINPKVAAFFAGVGPDAEPGQDGCIIAIDPDDWVEMLRIVAEVQHWPTNAWPEKIIVNVPNLWRLEAQSGHFVYLPIERAEGYIPVDRIVFPHDGTGFELTEDEIYPLRKSPLEERLDEFFTEELMRNNQQHFLEIVRALSASGQSSWVPFERSGSSKWLRPGKGTHESWRSVPQGWLAYIHEKLPEMRDRTATQLLLDPTEPLKEQDSLLKTVRSFLDERPGARQKAVDWKVVSITRDTPRGWANFVECAANRTWDGIRRLPFTDDQVAWSVTMTVVLACANVSERPSFSARDFSDLLGPVLHMELANARNVTARAAMAETTYERTLRPDLDDVIVPELLDSPRQQLRQILAPAYLFQFELLVEAFARELIPTQVLIQSRDLAVFFSPVRIPVIGAA